MTDSFAQAMVFFLVVLFVLGLIFPIIAHYKGNPKLKKLGYLFMILFSLLLVFCLAAVGLTIGATADDGWDVSDIPEEYRLPISCNDTLMTVYDNRGNEWSLQHRALNPDESCYDLLTIEGSGTITEIPDEIWNYRDNVRFIIVEGCSVGDNLFTKFDNVELFAIMGRTSSEQLKIGMEAF